MGFKARKLKKGLFEVIGLEAFIEKRIAAWVKRAPAGAASRAVSRAVKRARVVSNGAKRAPVAPPTTVDHLVAKLDAHPKRAALVRAGKQKDQLLRSLIPLYLAQKLNRLEITSGDTSEFWRLNGVKYLAPNAAKALREHVGYARRTKVGPQITPNGVRYVETALKGLTLRGAA